MKTLKLIEYHLQALNKYTFLEQSELKEGEKYIIKILTNAFIFNPLLFDKTKQKYIVKRIESIKKMVNVPISKIVDELKNIIALDSSLRVESRTLNLIDSYIFLVEQEADATELQPSNSNKEQSPASEITINANAADSENDLSLEEIFPLYKELIIKALEHSPTDEELMMIKPIVREFADSDPEKIVEAIQNMLSQSLEDREVEDNLSNA